jgi:hypothetical protein
MAEDNDIFVLIERLQRRVDKLESEKLDRGDLMGLLQDDHDVQRALFWAVSKSARERVRQGLVPLTD